MPTKSTSGNSATKPKAAKAAAKAVKPKAAASKMKTPAKAAASRAPTKAAAPAKPKPPAKAAKPKTPAKKSARGPADTVALEPLEAVRPLLKVRQARQFTTKQVTKAELEAITEVARWSGSSRNEQPCRFITIRDRDLIRRVAELGLPQTRGLPTATAAVAIIVPEEPEREFSRAFDDGRAAERMLIAAHMLGLGGGISRVRADVRPGINKALRLPSNRSVRTIVAFGHPTEDALQPKTRPGKARLPREEVIFEECWPETPVRD
jgi:nitroreductase